ncbi:MAG: hypothetical protein ACLFOY_18770 [Desulfatibacillaceae bacterium]
MEQQETKSTTVPKKRKRERIKESLRKNGQLGIIFIASLLLFTVVLVMKDSPWFQGLYGDSFPRLDPEAVTSMVISPDRASAKGRMLVTRPVTIEDQDTVEAVCRALNRSHPTRPGSLPPAWSCVVTLSMAEGDLSTTLQKIILGRREVVRVNVLVRDAAGWRTHDFRSEDLVGILEHVAGRNSRKG